MCGTALFLASTVQQLGLYFGATAGKAGFLTSCYIIIVPLLGLFFKKTCGWNVWVGVVLTLIGLYLLCMKNTFSFSMADVLLLLCALIFSFHILIIDYFSPMVDGIRMSCIQFFVCGIFSFIPMYQIDMNHSVKGITDWASCLSSFQTWIPLLYAGIMSCGVAYTLQIVAQDGLNPTLASLLMSLESVFSVIAGWLILKESMGIREISGCAIMFIAIILAQLPLSSKYKS